MAKFLGSIRLSSVLIVIFVIGGVVAAVLGQEVWDSLILLAVLIAFFR